LKVYNLDGDGESAYNTCENTSIASDGLKSLAIGGLEKKVDIIKVEEEPQVDSPALAMKFECKIRKIKWTGKFVMGVADDSAA